MSDQKRVRHLLLAMRTFHAAVFLCGVSVEQLLSFKTVHTLRLLTFELFGIVGLFLVTIQKMECQEMHFARFAPEK